MTAIALWSVSLAWGSLPAEPGDDPAQVEFFEKKVRPVLVEHCYKCHSAQAKKLKGDLLLDSREVGAGPKPASRSARLVKRPLRERRQSL